MSSFRYKGRDRSGNARTGKVSGGEKPELFVERAFDNGWRQLSVLNDEGRQIGAIAETPRRTWWAEVAGVS